MPDFSPLSYEPADVDAHGLAARMIQWTRRALVVGIIGVMFLLTGWLVGSRVRADDWTLFFISTLCYCVGIVLGVVTATIGALAAIRLTPMNLPVFECGVAITVGVLVAAGGLWLGFDSISGLYTVLLH